MSHSSSDDDIVGVEVYCKCGHDFTAMAPEWPPKVIICTGCHQLLELIAYDPETGKTAFRRIKS